MFTDEQAKHFLFFTPFKITLTKNEKRKNKTSYFVQKNIFVGIFGKETKNIIIFLCIRSSKYFYRWWKSVRIFEKIDTYHEMSEEILYFNARFIFFFTLSLDKLRYRPRRENFEQSR